MLSNFLSRGTKLLDSSKQNGGHQSLTRTNLKTSVAPAVGQVQIRIVDVAFVQLAILGVGHRQVREVQIT